MRPWLKGMLWMLITFIVVWALVIFAWRAQHRMPDTGEIGLYLFGLPLGIFALILLIKNYSNKLWQANTNATQSDLTNSTQQTEAVALKRAPSEEPLRHASVLDATLICLHGQNGHEIVNSHRSGVSALALDEVLTDNEGYPILTGRIQDLDTEDTWQAFLLWQSSMGIIEHKWLDEDMRAIVLGTKVTAALSDTLTQLAHFPTSPLVRESTGGAKPLQTPLHLQLFSYFPKRWNSAQQTTVTQWLTHQLHQFGWGQERIQVAEHGADHVMTPSDAIHEYIQTCAHRSNPPLGLIMSCMSNIGEHSASRWESYPPRFKNQSGHALGEAAASLLLWTSDVEFAELNLSTTHLFPVGKSQLDKSKNPLMDQEANGMSQSMQLATAAAKIAHDQIGFVVADGCQDTHQAIELATSWPTLLGHLDWNEHGYRVSSACGDLEATSDLLSKVIGHQLLIHDEAITNVLCIQHRDTIARHGVVMTKPPQSTETNT